MAVILEGELLEEAKSFLKNAAKKAKQIFELAQQLVEEDLKLKDIEKKVEEEIEKEFLLAFPAQISHDYIAAHLCMSEKKASEVDFIKLDIGMMNERGIILDTAKTLKGNKEMISAVELALKEALKEAKPNRKVSDIGNIIENVLSSKGFAPIRNLGGHGLGLKSIHETPSIPNFNNNSDIILKEGMLIAIEPFATNGVGLVKEEGNANIFELMKGAKARTTEAKRLMQLFPSGRPFSYRQIEKHKIKLGFLSLKNFIRSYPPLVEVSKAPVVQAENTVIVLEKPFFVEI